MCSPMLYTNRSFEICQVRMFVKQRRTHSWSSYLPGKNIFKAKIVKSLHHFVLSQWKRFWVYIYEHCSSMCSQMLYPNRRFEIWQVWMFVKQRRTHGWSTYLLSKKIFMLKQKSSNLYIIGFNSVRKFLIVYSHYIRNRSQWNAMWWDNQPHGYSSTLRNACVTAGKIYHGCFEMLSWPNRTSTNIINICFCLQETCMKCRTV